MRANNKVNQLGVSLGNNIKLARVRRNITQESLASDSGISRPTLSNLEAGDLGVGIGALISVMISLGLEKEISRLGFSDTSGRLLQDQQLKSRVKKGI